MFNSFISGSRGLLLICLFHLSTAAPPPLRNWAAPSDSYSVSSEHDLQRRQSSLSSYVLEYGESATMIESQLPTFV
jgi:hypothetical protein